MTASTWLASVRWRPRTLSSLSPRNSPPRVKILLGSFQLSICSDVGCSKRQVKDQGVSPFLILINININ
jgi:hypothetical protein